jgi:hypothetical protein
MRDHVRPRGHHWSTSGWDWALTVYDETATPDSIETLKRQLSEGE